MLHQRCYHEIADLQTERLLAELRNQVVHIGLTKLVPVGMTLKQPMEESSCYLPTTEDRKSKVNPVLHSST